MDFIQILLLTSFGLFITTATLFALSKRWLKTNTLRSYADFTPYGFFALLTCIFAIVILFVVGVSAAGYYTEAINLPYRYEAEDKTVTEARTLLMRYENLTSDNLGNLGYGLESLQLKDKLEDAIRRKNNLYAEIQGWLNNPLMPFRDLLRDTFNNIGYS